MSSLEPGVRTWSLPRVRADLAILLEGEAKTVKFVDRTFNFDAERANAIWAYLLDHNRASTFHFEIAADLLTDGNFDLLRRVPAGLFRFEIGVQSAGADTLERVARKSDLTRLAANVRRLLAETGVVVHLDLVAGLSGEDYGGFLASLGLLLSLGPHHIQVEPLKVLKGTAMRRIAERERYAWSAAPPYKILRTPCLSYHDIVRIETVARLLDLYYNSGRFGTALAQIGRLVERTAFWDRFAALPAWEEASSHLPLRDQFELFWQAAEPVAPADGRELVRDALCYDYCRTGYPAGDLPSFFPAEGLENPSPSIGGSHRQARLMVGDREGKVRGFSRCFARDYRVAGWPEGPVELVFGYLSAPDRGQQVFVERADTLAERVEVAAVV
jgi:anaerobic magnesium-protoporphyrin IX monomethyl ester cyclase